MSANGPKRAKAEEPTPDMLDDNVPPFKPLENDAVALALAIATARGEGDEASAKKLEAMLWPS